MKTIFTISLTALLVFGLAYASLPDAFASPGHSITFSPSTKKVVIGGTGIAAINVAIAQPDAVSGTATYVVEDRVPLSFSTPGSNAACVGRAAATTAAGAGLGAEDTQYALVTAPYTLPPTLVGVLFPGGATSSASLTVGPIGIASPVAGTTGSPIVYLTSGGVGSPVAAGTLRWIQTVGPSPGTFGIDHTVPNPTNLEGQRFIVACGCDDPGADGFCAGSDTDGVVAESYRVVKPVGGKILPIDTTALLIAGMSSTGLWVLPMLGVIAGVSFALLKFQVIKKNI